MRRNLESFGVENNVIQNFEGQEITPEIVATLTDSQLDELGLKTLGKRQLVKGRCQNMSNTATGEFQFPFTFKLVNICLQNILVCVLSIT